MTSCTTLSLGTRRQFPAPRVVHHGEALGWLAAHPAAPGASVVTSLPDVSELAHRDFDRWHAWFLEAARRVIDWIPSDGLAVFFQSDIRHEGHWVDKGFLVMTAAAAAGAHLVWHKIVCRHPPGTITPGRASYSHLLCVARSPRPQPTRPGPDVLADGGAMPWRRAMGVEACRVACRFLADESDTSVVVDPFCGHGTVLAAANAFGFAAVGVELSAKRARIAADFRLESTGWSRARSPQSTGGTSLEHSH